jgi:hypothetical protein
MKRTNSFVCTNLLAAFFPASLLLALGPAVALAQTSLAFTAGASAPFAHQSLIEEQVFSYFWPVGFDLGTRLEFPVTRWLLLNPTVGYRIYPFAGVDEEDLAQIDTRRFVSSTGEATQELFLGLGLRLQDPDEANSMAFFVDLRGGYEIERVGKITINWQDLSDGSVYPSEWPAEYRHLWTFLAGIGFRARLSSQFSLEPSLLWHKSGTDRNYALVTLDLVYTVPL